MSCRPPLPPLSRPAAPGGAPEAAGRGPGAASTRSENFGGSAGAAAIRPGPGPGPGCSSPARPGPAPARQGEGTRAGKGRSSAGPPPLPCPALPRESPDRPGGAGRGALTAPGGVAADPLRGAGSHGVSGPGSAAPGPQGMAASFQPEVAQTVSAALLEPEAKPARPAPLRGRTRSGRKLLRNVDVSQSCGSQLPGKHLCPGQKEVSEIIF